MRFERSFDYELIRRLVTEDAALYPAHCDDFSPPRDQFRPMEHADIWYLIASEDGLHLGLFVITRINTVMGQVHNVLSRKAWGPKGVEVVRGGVRWMFEHSPFRRLIGETPADLPRAVAFAKRCGFVEYGRNPQAVQRGGKLVDLVLMGISKD